MEFTIVYFKLYCAPIVQLSHRKLDAYGDMPIAAKWFFIWEFGIWNLLLFNDAWSQKGHSESNKTVILASSSLLRLLLLHIFHLINAKFCSHQNLLIYSIQFPGIQLLSLMVTMLIPCTEKIPLFTDFGQKNTPYFSQNEEFCRKKNHPFFSISRRAHCVRTPF